MSVQCGICAREDYWVGEHSCEHSVPRTSLRDLSSVHADTFRDSEILSLGRISFRVLWPSRGVLPMVPFAMQNGDVAGVNLKGDDIGVLRAVPPCSAEKMTLLL